jgi:Ca2+-binding RTX toxin-like protein
VPLNSAGVGTLFVPTANPDVYLDPASVTATVTGVTGGHYEAVDVTGASATAQIADTLDTTTITLNDVTVTEGGSFVYTASVNNAPQTTPLTITLDNSVTITIAVGAFSGSSVSTIAPNAPDGGSQLTVSIASATGGNYELLNKSDIAIVTINDHAPSDSVDDSITVEEESIPGIGGNDEIGDGYSYVATGGTFANNANWGPDGFGGIVSVNGVTTVVAGNITVSDAVGTLVVNVVSGAYTYTLNHNVLEAGAVENIQTAPSFAIVGKDTDGSAIGFNLNVSVVDDVPTLSVESLEVNRASGHTFGDLVFSDGADSVDFNSAFAASNALVWNHPVGDPYTFSRIGTTNEYQATYIDSNDLIKQYFTVTLKSDGTYDFNLVNPLPIQSVPSGSLLQGVAGGSGLASYTIDATKFGGAFALEMTGTDNGSPAKLTISNTELGVNGNTVQPGEKLKFDLIQQSGYENSSLDSLTIGIATTGSVSTNDHFLIDVHYVGGVTQQVNVTYDNSGNVTFNIDETKVVDYVELYSNVADNFNFKITGVQLEYTTTVSPADNLLNFTVTGVDGDSDTAIANFTVNVIAGTTGNDTLFTGANADTVSGGAGNDSISSGAGNDILNGGAGNDILIGGAGNDILTGGTGSDTFKFTASDFTSPSSDTITDFTVGVVGVNANADILSISDLLSGAHAANSSIPTDITNAISGGFLKVETVDANTARIVIDLDGSGAGSSVVSVATLQGIPSTDHATLLNTLLADHQLT